MRYSRLLFGLQIAACWPAWLWLARRFGDGGGEGCAVYAIAAALALSWREWRRQKHSASESAITPAGSAPTLVLLVYAGVCLFAAPSVRALFALFAVAAMLQNLLAITMPLGWWILWGLGLPALASLQFYIGYPLRLLAAAGATGLLRLTGLAVRREGVELLFGLQRVGVDAPCSGIRMLWAGVFLTALLAGAFRLDWRRTAVGFAGTLILVVVANVFRSAALFYIEAGLVRAPAWAHATTGVLVFALTTMVIVLLMGRLQRVNSCAVR